MTHDECLNINSSPVFLVITACSLQYLSHVKTVVIYYSTVVIIKYPTNNTVYINKYPTNIVISIIIIIMLD